MLFYQLPVNFRITYAIFHVANLISTLLVSVLMVMYQVSRRNRLLRSTCLLCFAVSLALFINFLRGDAHIYGGPDCQLQAVVLNYFYVSLHAHFCFFMMNSCFAALNWTFLGTKSPEMRTTVFIVASWMIPLLPTAFAIWRFLTDRKPTVLARHFYCAITSPSWPIFRFWFFSFSIPGLFFSFYLLFCTWRYRRMTFRLSKTSQIDRSELFRLVLTILLYIVLIAMSISRSGISENARPMYAVPWAKNPFKNPQFCRACDRKDYFCSRLCPALKSYLPVMVGCTLFAMYGFGNVASRCYRRLGAFLLGRTRSINSSAGTDDSRRSSHTAASEKRRLSSVSTVTQSISSQSQRPSLSLALFSQSSDNITTSSASFNQSDLHPNLSVVPEASSSEESLRRASASLSSSSHSARHHPILPSIDEDLEVLYMHVNNRPAFKRQFHRRFSEPTIPASSAPYSLKDYEDFILRNELSININTDNNAVANNNNNKNYNVEDGNFIFEKLDIDNNFEEDGDEPNIENNKRGAT